MNYKKCDSKNGTDYTFRKKYQTVTKFSLKSKNKIDFYAYRRFRFRLFYMTALFTHILYVQLENQILIYKKYYSIFYILYKEIKNLKIEER